MKKMIIGLLLMVAFLAGTVTAITPYAAYDSHTGNIYPSGGTIAEAVAVPDDDKFIQMDVDSTITLKFPSYYAAVPDGTSAADLQVNIYDAAFPANADIFVSVDGSNWMLVENYADTANIDLDMDGIGPAKYIKIVQDSYYIDPAYPTMGFDLDAVVALNMQADADGDGYYTTVDCNDADAEINPGASEVCDGVDNDCDSAIDEDLTAPAADNQNGVCAGTVKVCDGTNGWQEPDYTLITGYEKTEVTCDTKDNNCDGIVDQHVCEWYCTATDNDKTSMPKISLQTNRWMYNPSASTNTFVTVPPKGKGWIKGYTLESTNYCSCSQILKQLNKYNPITYGDMGGHWKYGCSISVMNEFIRLVEQPKVFTASDSSYYNTPTPTPAELYATGPISFSWFPISGTVIGGHYNEKVPPNTGTVYYNIVTGSTVVGDTVSLTFMRTVPNTYGPMYLTGTLSGNVLTGNLDGPYYFEATGTVTP